MLASDTVVAHDNQLTVAIEMLNPGGGLAEWAEDGPLDVGHGIFVCFAHVDELHGGLRLALLLDIKNIYVAVVQNYTFYAKTSINIHSIPALIISDQSWYV